MGKRERRKARDRGAKDTAHRNAVQRVVTPEKREEPARSPRSRSCFDCVFCIANVIFWLRKSLSAPAGGMCMNHPDAPGRVHEIPRTPCRNFRLKPEINRVTPPQPPNDKIRYIPLTRRLFAIVDAEDYEGLSKYKWSVQPSANHNTWYAKRIYRGRLVLMHREIMNPPRGMFVDHINGNGLDNRRCNLRICTPKQNSCNRSKMRGARHKYIGVSRRRDGKYEVHVMCDGKSHYGGAFNDEVEAAKVRDRLAVKLHGPFARLNFPPDAPDEEEQ